ncbi:RNI-like protein [Basidiobolus meristosporus CBS 931.73]|uniref:RNI-like protein n=1 Tax=Basidiobolus meristosporus CBS 931.73 TaxID=1314790 RepID=A0A1Y1Y776_9FUNG|nr:RNI-like protein [Basidiobolus meristosporus CBS 931.73]|eukprot:ORX93870.1 RNI-like protein [Basidiobolus meristosporus CBS 931.73]
MATSTWASFTSGESGAYVKITTTELLNKFIDEISSNDAFAKALKGLDVSPLFMHQIQSSEDEEEDLQIHECNAEGSNACLFNDSQLTTVIEKCSNLEVLCIGYGPQIIVAGDLINISGPEAGIDTSNGPACLSEDVLKRVSELSKLEILNLYGCDNLSQDIVAQIGRGCPNLKQLCIDGEGDDEDDDGFEDISDDEEAVEGEEAEDKVAEEEVVEEEEERPWTVEDWKAFQNLEVLSADSVELAVVADLPKLTHVQIYPFAEPDVLKKFIESHADSLRYINVAEEYDYEDADEVSVSHARMPSEIFKCAKLESFNTDVFDYKEARADGFLTKVIESFPNLKHLEIAADVEVASTAQIVASKLTNLETLVWESESVGDEAVETIVKALTNLRNLQLSFSEKLSESTVGLIAEGLKNLEQINVNTITPAGFEVFKNNCPHLSEIGVIQGENLTKEHLANINEKLPNLRSVCVGGEIPEEMLDALMNVVPDVEYNIEGLDESDEE